MELLHHQGCATESLALEIAKAMLARTTRALETDDFILFESCFLVPHEIQTFGGNRILSTRRELKRAFDQVRNYYASLNVTRLVRTCTEAEFLDDDTMQFTHVNHLLNDTTLVRESFPTLTVVRRVNGAWKAASSVYAVHQDTSHEEALTS
ncbi:MAG: hypothetical protein AAF479_07595 [Pseudomonadota bacterium]